MASATVEQLISDVAGITGADPNLCRTWVRDAARRTMEARNWSWLMRRGQFVVPAAVGSGGSNGTCTLTQGSTTVTFSAAIITTDMVGRQFRGVTTSGPIYDIVRYNSATSVEISPAWGDATAAAVAFSIVQAFLELPSDCQMLLSVISISDRYQLRLQQSRESLDWYDPSRSRIGSTPRLLCALDYTQILAGRFSAPVTLLGASAAPASGGSYTGQQDAVFAAQITTGGIGGVAVFQWRKGSNAWVTAVTTDAAVTYSINDTWVWRATSTPQPGSPRVEMYPYPVVAAVFPYYYMQRYPDITDDGTVLPGILERRSDVIREKALEFAATYAGTDDQPNVYAQINRRDYHAASWRDLVEELSRQDNELSQRNVGNAQQFQLPFAPFPWGPIGDPQTSDPDWLYYGFPAY